MHISKIIVKNYRLLKDFEIDLEKELSLVVGKNNTGKTSLLSVLQVFLSKNRDIANIVYSDFNLDYRTELKSILQQDDFDIETYKEDGIHLRLVIEYTDNDNLEYLSKAIITLDPDNNVVVLGFDYILTKEKLLQLRNDYRDFVAKENDRKNKNKEYQALDIDEFLESRMQKVFVLLKKSIGYDMETCKIKEGKYTELARDFRLEDVISFRYISAKRDVDNNERQRTLSSLIADLYEIKEKDDSLKETTDKFKSQMKQTDLILNKLYTTHFHDITDKIKDFGGIVKDESKLAVTSTLHHKDILNKNTTIVYDQDNQQRPESHNGLGYMNLIAMIVDIERIREEMKREEMQKPADINLLFIEEPEAHTHPQMQYIFIKNIKKLLADGVHTSKGVGRPIQSIISTHSSHIVSECQFTDIKYLRRNGSNSVESRNMSDLEKEYGEEKEAYRFLKQYLTLSRSELFFADKAILIEGDTERILLPAMMRKIDEENHPDEEMPLLSQNISTIEVGAYSQIFGKFINFIGLKKCLILTDIDIAKKGNDHGHKTACSYVEGAPLYTTNTAIQSYFSSDKLADIKGRALEDRLFLWNLEEKKWEQDKAGNMLVSFQQEENGYQARSFEDNFFHVNQDFFASDDNPFVEGLKTTYRTNYKNDKDAYKLAIGILSKSALAIEVLLNSKESEDGQKHYTNWNVPSYIKEGLTWLRKG